MVKQLELANLDDKDLDNELLFPEEEEEDNAIYEQDRLIYKPEQINIITQKPTIEQLLRRINEQALDLAPDFQRHANLWKDEAKSRLIESIIIRIPLPAFYIDATDEDKWLVVDGIQRLYAIKQFVNDKTLRLCGLEYLDLKGKSYDELERRYQRRIEETQVTVYLIEKGTPPEVKYNIFKRINTGGLPLSPQELRHALNPGKGTHFLSDLADSEEFKSVAPLGKTRKMRMDDREFILGFFAFTLNSFEEYKNNRNVFLTRGLNKLNNFSSDELENRAKQFRKIMIDLKDIFGDNAFRKPKKNITGKKYPINQALFESWSVNIAQLSDEDIERLKNHKDELLYRLAEEIKNNGDFEKSISQTTEKVDYRFSKISEIIQEVLL